MYREVTLDMAEVINGCVIGGLRAFNALSNGREDVVRGWAHDYNNVFERHITGALGEIAAAKLLGRYWDGRIGPSKAADIGVAIQVRTRPVHSWDLPIHPDDPIDHAYVLVTGIGPTFRVHGWIKGVDAMVPDRLTKLRSDLPACYLVKQGELHEIPEGSIVRAAAA